MYIIHPCKRNIIIRLHRGHDPDELGLVLRSQKYNNSNLSDGDALMYYVALYERNLLK